MYAIIKHCDIRHIFDIYLIRVLNGMLHFCRIWNRALEMKPGTIVCSEMLFSDSDDARVLIKVQSRNAACIDI